MTSDKEFCEDDVERKACESKHNKLDFVIEDIETAMVEGDSSEIGISRAINLPNISLGNSHLDSVDTVQIPKNETRDEHGASYDSYKANETENFDSVIELPSEIVEEDEVSRMTDKFSCAKDKSEKKNPDNETGNFSSHITVTKDTGDACIDIENINSFTDLCVQSRTRNDCTSKSSVDSIGSTDTSDQTVGQECILNLDGNSDNMESGCVFEEDDENFESVCRICHCGEDAENLISPCLCTGSVRFVHHTCLMSWLQRTVKAKCEICLHNLAVRRKTKSFKKWGLPDGKPIPIIWMVTFVCALTLNVASITKDASQRCTSNACIVFYVLGAIGVLLGLAFFYHWLKKSIKYIQKWIALNEEWTLVGPKDLSKLGYTNAVVVSRKSVSETPPEENEAGPI